MIKLKLTCHACPEQYDAFNEQGEQIGYLRLRHGYFSVECPDVGGALVYDASPEGDGIFENNERDYYLRFAVQAIERYAANGPPPKPEAPDVQYEVEG